MEATATTTDYIIQKRTGACTTEDPWVYTDFMRVLDARSMFDGTAHAALDAMNAQAPEGTRYGIIGIER